MFHNWCDQVIHVTCLILQFIVSFHLLFIIMAPESIQNLLFLFTTNPSFTAYSKPTPKSRRVFSPSSSLARRIWNRAPYWGRTHFASWQPWKSACPGSNIPKRSRSSWNSSVDDMSTTLLNMTTLMYVLLGGLISILRLGLVIVLRRISDYGYITAPL